MDPESYQRAVLFPEGLKVVGPYDKGIFRRRDEVMRALIIEFLIFYLKEIIISNMRITMSFDAKESHVSRNFSS